MIDFKLNGRGDGCTLIVECPGTAFDNTGLVGAGGGAADMLVKCQAAGCFVGTAAKARAEIMTAIVGVTNHAD